MPVSLGVEIHIVGQHARQHVGDEADEQGAHAGLEVVRVRTADGEQRELSFVPEAEHRRGPDVAACVSKQESQV